MDIGSLTKAFKNTQIETSFDGTAFVHPDLRTARRMFKNLEEGNPGMFADAAEIAKRERMIRNSLTFAQAGIHQLVEGTTTTAAEMERRLANAMKAQYERTAREKFSALQDIDNLISFDSAVADINACVDSAGISLADLSDSAETVSDVESYIQRLRGEIQLKPVRAFARNFCNFSITLATPGDIDDEYDNILSQLAEALRGEGAKPHSADVRHLKLNGSDVISDNQEQLAHAHREHHRKGAKACYAFIKEKPEHVTVVGHYNWMLRHIHSAGMHITDLEPEGSPERIGIEERLQAIVAKHTKPKRKDPLPGFR